MVFAPSRLTIVDDFSLGKQRNIEQFAGDPRVSIHRQDASDLQRLSETMNREKTQVVFNLAVIPLPKSLVNPKETVDVNVTITTTVCELLRLEKFETLIHCSSSEIYGSASFTQMNEDHPARPITPYAASKIACDHVVLSYYKTFGVDASIARPFNAYGPRQNEGSYAGVIPTTIRRILSGEPPIITGDGLQTRDFTYVSDIADGIVRLYRSKETRGAAINIASGREVTIKSLVNLITHLMNYKGKVMFASPRPGDVKRHRADISMAKRLLGYSSRTGLETGLKKTISWYKRQSRLQPSAQ
jgi:UDP-glucose 4-epimerase